MSMSASNIAELMPSLMGVERRGCAIDAIVSLAGLTFPRLNYRHEKLFVKAQAGSARQSARANAPGYCKFG
jgi:hypothetical protein